jgi:hypothetical protein
MTARFPPILRGQRSPDDKLCATSDNRRSAERSTVTYRQLTKGEFNMKQVLGPPEGGSGGASAFIK